MMGRISAAFAAVAAGIVLVSSAPASAQDFGPPGVISNTVPNSDTGSDYLPRVTTDGAGHWVAVWGTDDTLGGTIGVDADILISRSADDGATWTAPATLNTNAATDSAYDVDAQVTTDGAGHWVAAWYSNDSLGGTIGTDFDILVSRSTDDGATWTAPAALNTNAATDSGRDSEPQVKTDGAGNWVAVWFSDNSLGGTIGTDGDLLVSRSTDNGVTWTAPAVLNSNAAADSAGDYRPQLTTDRVGNWVTVWDSGVDLGGPTDTDRDILVSRSTDNGATWTSPTNLNTNAMTDSGDDRSPQLSTDGAGSWIAVWNSSDSLGGTIDNDWDVLVSRSTNNGATWTAPAALNTNAATDSVGDYSPHVTTDGAGNWVAVWQSGGLTGGTVGTDLDILVSRSTDDGATWTAQVALNTNAVTDRGQDFSQRVATDGLGNWVAVWVSSDSLGATIGGDTDILVSRSTDNGATWTAPAALNTNAASDPGKDYEPQLATDGAGHWVAVWYSEDRLGGTLGSDNNILTSRSADDGTTWTAPAALKTNAASRSGDDYSPQVTTDGGGNWIAVWYSYDSLGFTIGSDLDILVSRSTDDGATWTAPAALNTNAATDSGRDYDPQLTTDGAGNWIAVWYSNDSLGGTIGTDYDILVSRSTDNAATWTAAAALNTNAATDSGGDLVPQLTTDLAGNWVAVWYSTDNLGGTIGWGGAILVSRSTNNGATWTAPAALSTNAATDTAKLAFPQTTTDGAGNWIAVWYSTDSLGGTIGTDEDILFSRSTDNGATWTAAAALNTNAATDLGYDYDPQLTFDGAGNWVAVWQSWDSLGDTIGWDYDILVSRSTDNGMTWTAPVALNANAATDVGADAVPQLATNGAGNWIAIWQSTDGLGGAASYGVPDIFVATGTLCGDSFLAGTEECDDANLESGDCCSSGCGLEIVDSSSCFVALSTKLQISDTADDTEDKMSWQWSKGEGVVKADLGTPHSTTDYKLCVFDVHGSETSLAASLQIPSSSTSWVDKDEKGFRYKDKDGAASGVTGVSLTPGVATMSKVRLTAKGAAIGLPGPASSQYFAQDPKVVAQLTNSNGSCWTSEFTVGDTARNTATSFRAKTN